MANPSINVSVDLARVHVVSDQESITLAAPTGTRLVVYVLKQDTTRKNAYEPDVMELALVVTETGWLDLIIRR